jgi:hypothetical protein
MMEVNGVDAELALSAQDDSKKSIKAERSRIRWLPQPGNNVTSQNFVSSRFEGSFFQSM